MSARLVVLASGSGTNLQAIIDATASGRLDAAVVAVVANGAEFAPDLVMLAGWMRLPRKAFLKGFRRRVVNLHPALPGDLPRLHANKRAYCISA